MTRKGGMEEITYHSRKRKSLGISDFSVLASWTDWEAQVEWTFSHATSTSWLLFISSFFFTIPGSPTHWPNNGKVRLLSIVSIHAIHPLLHFLFHSSNKYSVLWSRKRESWFLGANPICPKIPFNHPYGWRLLRGATNRCKRIRRTEARVYIN